MPKGVTVTADTPLFATGIINYRIRELRVDRSAQSPRDPRQEPASCTIFARSGASRIFAAPSAQRRGNDVSAEKSLRSALRGGGGELWEVAPGLVGLRGDAGRLFRALERSIAELCGAETGDEWRVPPALPLATLERAEYFASFPQWLTLAAHLSGDDDVLRQVAESTPRPERDRRWRANLPRQRPCATTYMPRSRPASSRTPFSVTATWAPRSTEGTSRCIVIGVHDARSRVALRSRRPCVLERRWNA